MYVFPIEPQIAPEMAHLHKKLGECSSILRQSIQINAESFNLKTSLKLRF